MRSDSPRASALRGIILCCGLIPALAGCQDPLRIKLNPGVQLPCKSVVIFFADGVDLHRFDSMVAGGELPNIKRVFVDGGVQVGKAVTGLPSITYPNCTSLITGVYPGHHGIMGNFWFDRRHLETHYYMTYASYRTINNHFSVPTLYDILSDHFTFNIQDHTRRGVTASIDNHESFGIAWFLHYYVYADWYSGMSFSELPGIANLAKRWPAVIMTYYPAVDEIGHRYGSDTPKYGETLQNIDRVVGKITGAINEAGLADRTYFVFVTDHSHVPTHANHSDLRHFLRKSRHLRLRSEPLDREEYHYRLAAFKKYDAVGGVDEDRAVMFHLRGRNGWECRPGDAEVEEWVKAEPAFTDVPGVRFAVVRAGKDRVHVLSRNGSVFVERRIQNGRPEYRLVPEQGDPLEYAKDAALSQFAAAGWHGSREWLAASIDAEDPDFVSQVVEVFDSPHTGDVVLFADNGWSFDPQQQGGHGSCTRYDMRIPLFFAGSDLPKGAAIPLGRSVDVTPTIVGLLGEGRRLKNYQLDGIDLSEQLRQATPRVAASAPGASTGFTEAGSVSGIADRR